MRADLHLVASDEQGGNALLLWVALRGFDLYVGSDPRKPPLSRASFHKSGVHHIHWKEASTLRAPNRMKLSEITGIRRIPGVGATFPLEWAYKCKPDTPTRRTTVIDFSKVYAWGVELFAIPKARRGVTSWLEQNKDKGPKRILGYVLADWTDPQLLALAYTGPTPPGFNPAKGDRAVLLSL